MLFLEPRMLIILNRNLVLLQTPRSVLVGAWAESHILLQQGVVRIERLQLSSVPFMGVHVGVGHDGQPRDGFQQHSGSCEGVFLGSVFERVFRSGK